MIAKLCTCESEEKAFVSENEPEEDISSARELEDHSYSENESEKGNQTKSSECDT